MVDSIYVKSIVTNMIPKKWKVRNEWKYCQYKTVIYRDS